MPAKKPKPARAAHDRHPIDRGAAPGEAELLALAKRVSEATGDPVVGGVAVILHGGGRSTVDIDLFSSDLWETHRKLEAAGFLWDSARREHAMNGVAVHMVNADQLGGPPKRVSTIRGIRVISLADLVRVKLSLGLAEPGRFKDLAHVLDLIGRVPLNKDFAAKLPTRLRAAFKELVDQVHKERGCPAPKLLAPKPFIARHGAPRRRRAI